MLRPIWNSKRRLSVNSLGNRFGGAIVEASLDKADLLGLLRFGQVLVTLNFIRWRCWRTYVRNKSTLLRNKSFDHNETTIRDSALRRKVPT